MGIFIDNKYFKFFNKKYTILQFCLSSGISIPFFCYHDLLSIAGNCRMCLVEVNTILVASCALNINDNMVIYTNNYRIRLARESILEFLLVNHPLDCPVCDEGGECDLQDIALTYGSDIGHFNRYYKRSVDNLNCCGPLIKTVMTRCIHCTRCVRFVNEVSDNFDLGVIGRGSSMEIGTYIEKFLNDELIGNIVDLCPVGALISMPYSFTSRAWELLHIRSIDVLDSLGSSIRIDVSNNKIMRIVPSLDGLVNNEWITNKIRFSYDSLSIQRLNFPKISINNKFMPIGWHYAIILYLLKLYLNKFNYIQAICGPFIDLKDSLYLKEFFNSFGCSNINYYENNNLYSLFDFRFYYLLNDTIINLEKYNYIFFIGTNLRMELPLLNLRLRKSYLDNKYINSYSIGLSLNYLTFPVKNLGNSISFLIKLIEGKFFLNFIIFFSNFFNINFFNINFIKKFQFFIGVSVLNRIDSNNILFSILYIFNILKLYTHKSINIISKFLGRISSFEIGILPGINTNTFYKKKNNIFFNHFCGIDFDVYNINNINNSNINIYQGPFYLNYFIKLIWLILPSGIFTEFYYNYLNIEGRYRLTQKAITAASSVFKDDYIFKILFNNKNNIIKNNFSIIYNFNNIINYFNHIIIYLNIDLFKFNLNNIISFSKLNNNIQINKIKILLNYNLKLINNTFNKYLYNSYLSENITKNSKIINRLSNLLINKNWNSI